MSQKTTIITVKHSGAPVYLGEVSGNDRYTCNPHTIMDWLCDGYRTRFNQHRSKRCTYNHNGELVPIGETVCDIKDSEARREYPYLSALPSMVIQSAEKKESTEWFSAVKRRKTSGGKTPRFKSRKRWDMQFVCWERGTTFQQTGKKTGMITIKGQNPKGKTKPGHKGARWAIKIRIRLSQKIRSYTSTVVNWSKGTVVFTNPPQPVKKADSPAPVVGCDRGGAIPLATSDGVALVPDMKKLSEWEKRNKFHQKKMGKARSRAEKSGGTAAKNQVAKGYAYQHHKKEAAKYSRKIAAYRNGWIQEVTTELVRNYHTIVLEDLKVKSMTAKGKGRRKRGMNRSFLSAAPSTIAQCLEYKCTINGNTLAYIPAHHTSQRCNNCGHTHKDNRESQAIFRCIHCGYSNNADINAAHNIRDYYLLWITLEGTDLPAHTSANDGGGTVRPKIPKGMIDQFYHGAPYDAANPPNGTVKV